MKIRAFIQSHYGKMIISFLLGFGLSTFFRKTCKEKECIQFKGPPMEDIEKNTYTQGGRCYRFIPHTTRCSSIKKIVKFA